MQLDLFKDTAFLYLWYDSPNKKYYLGKHKGTPEDSYTHSSTVWGSFTKNNIPKGVRRRILAYGTDESMVELEVKLLTNRKKKGKLYWDRYYNVKWTTRAVGALKLEKNHKWKGGISLGKKRPGYQKKRYANRKKLCKKLMAQGLTFYQIKEKCPQAIIAYPRDLLPQEEKDRIAARQRKNYRKKHKHKRECYCRQYSCHYCGPILIASYGKAEEKKEKRKKYDAEKYYKDKSDPLKLAHKQKVAKEWEEKNKEKRKNKKKEWYKKTYVKKPRRDMSGKNNPFYGKKHTPESIKQMSNSSKTK